MFAGWLHYTLTFRQIAVTLQWLNDELTGDDHHWTLLRLHDASDVMTADARRISVIPGAARSN